MVKKIRTFCKNEDLVSERRTHIVKESTKLFIKRGYKDTNTRKLSEALGMSKGALYHYIGSKDDILYLVIDFALENQERLINTMKEHSQGLNSVEALKKSIRIYYTNVDEMQDMYNFNNHSIGDMPKKDRHILFDSEEHMMSYFSDLLIKGVKTGEFLCHDTRMISHNIVVIANAWANRRWFLRKYYKIEDYIKEETENLLKMILPQSG